MKLICISNKCLPIYSLQIPKPDPIIFKGNKINSSNFDLKFQNLKKDDIFECLSHIEKNAKNGNIEYPKEKLNLISNILNRITNSSENGIAFVAKDKNEKIISSCMVDYFSDYKNKKVKNGEILGVYTLPDYQNMGIAYFMLKNLIKSSKDNGCKNLFLYTRNNSAKHLYKKLGFEQIMPSEHNGRTVMQLML